MSILKITNHITCKDTRMASRLWAGSRSGTKLLVEFLLIFTLFQAAFSLPIAFSESLEGSVIKMKPFTPAPQDTEVSLKA